jgi:hypothetical protein
MGIPAWTSANVEALLHDREIELVDLKNKSLLLRQWANSHKMTLLQLLATLGQAVAAEQHMLRFDYISLHLRCLRLLHELHASIDDKLREYFGSTYMENDTQLPFLVSWIFTVAAETENYRESVRHQGRVESLMLRKASITVRGFIEKEGV